MVFVNSISDLDYYNHNPSAPCYCESLVYPADLVLQDTIPVVGSPELVLRVFVVSADGLTEYEQASTYFSYYFFTLNGLTYFNLRLNSYSPAMCEHLCWILRVRVTIGSEAVVFNKYTQKYCQADCCDTPRDITFPDDNPPTAPVPTVPTYPATKCGDPLIRIQVTFDCLDNQLGEYYGIPAGQTWGFTKITNIQGKVKQKPRDITRIISYNCNTQRAESFIPYRLESEGEGTFPAWKLNEFEAMFHAPKISVTDFVTAHTFQFDGGTIARELGAAVCWNLFQLDVTLRTCFVRQTYGCNDGCDNATQSLTFLIPQNYSGQNFYDENRALIGDFADLLDWYASRDLVVSVTDVSAEYDNIAEAFRVTSMGYIPTQIYMGAATPRNRIFGVNSPSSPVIDCAMPVIGTPYSEAIVCATPHTGTIYGETITPEEVDIQNFRDWEVVSPSKVYVSGNWALLKINMSNAEVIETSPLTYFNQEIIGVIDAPGIPATPQQIIIDENNLINIDTFGRIYYTGYPTAYGEAVFITYNNIYYYVA